MASCYDMDKVSWIRVTIRVQLGLELCHDYDMCGDYELIPSK